MASEPCRAQPGILRAIALPVRDKAIGKYSAAHRYGTVRVALRNQPSSGAVRTLPPFWTGQPTFALIS